MSAVPYRPRVLPVLIHQAAWYGWKCLVLLLGTEQHNVIVLLIAFTDLEKRGWERHWEYCSLPYLCPWAMSAIPKDRQQDAKSAGDRAPGRSCHTHPWQLSFLYFALNPPHTRFIISWPVPWWQAERICASSPHREALGVCPEGSLKSSPS